MSDQSLPTLHSDNLGDCPRTVPHASPTDGSSNLFFQILAHFTAHRRLRLPSHVAKEKTTWDVWKGDGECRNTLNVKKKVVAENININFSEAKTAIGSPPKWMTIGNSSFGWRLPLGNLKWNKSQFVSTLKSLIVHLGPHSFPVCSMSSFFENSSLETLGPKCCAMKPHLFLAHKSHSKSEKMLHSKWDCSKSLTQPTLRPLAASTLKFSLMDFTKFVGSQCSAAHGSGLASNLTTKIFQLERPLPLPF